jgi:hypothetical protein
LIKETNKRTILVFNLVQTNQFKFHISCITNTTKIYCELALIIKTAVMAGITSAHIYVQNDFQVFIIV